MTRVLLFVPCYVDQFHPRVAIATLRLLERLGFTVEFPRAQTCCAQPLYNLGHTADARAIARRFARAFAGTDAVVAPSGSCVAMVREHYHALLDPDTAAGLAARTFELCEFLHDELALPDLGATCARRVSIHRGCHHLRALRAGPASERAVAVPDKLRRVLETVRGIELVEPALRDACCGFGGTFSVSEPALSARMGDERIDDHAACAPEVITSADMSCLMHLHGVLRRRRAGIAVRHVAEILAGDLAS